MRHMINYLRAVNRHEDIICMRNLIEFAVDNNAALCRRLASLSLTLGMKRACLTVALILSRWVRCFYQFVSHRSFDVAILTLS